MHKKDKVLVTERVRLVLEVPEDEQHLVRVNPEKEQEHGSNDASEKR